MRIFSEIGFYSALQVYLAPAHCLSHYYLSLKDPPTASLHPSASDIPCPLLATRFALLPRIVKTVGSYIQGYRRARIKVVTGPVESAENLTRPA